MKTAIEDDDSNGLGYYHWQFPEAENFLMMAIVRREKGEYPVQFAVPASLEIWEISASLWISQWTIMNCPLRRGNFGRFGLDRQAMRQGHLQREG